MGLTVIYRETASAGLRHLRAADPAAFARVRDVIRALAADPYPQGAVRWGGSGFCRLHAGDIRVLYEVDQDTRAVYILNVTAGS